MLKIIFVATQEFAIPTLQKLLTSEHKILAIITQPDRLAGRGKKLSPPPIKEFAKNFNLAIWQVETFNNPEVIKKISDLNPDLIIDVACGLIVPQAILKIPRLGIINIHPSLLPRWRGAAPIQRAILAGDKETGVAIMQMEETLDTGAIYRVQKINIEPTDTYLSLINKLSEIGANLLLEVLKDLEENKANLIPQKNHATYAKKIDKEEARIDWKKSATEIERMIRAFNPHPIAFAEINNVKIRIWEARANIDFDHQKNPGTILKIDPEKIEIACGQGILQILKLQLPGKNIISARDFYNAKHWDKK
jgi:methionyl-tRNA formyltransferase